MAGRRTLPMAINRVHRLVTRSASAAGCKELLVITPLRQYSALVGDTSSGIGHVVVRRRFSSTDSFAVLASGTKSDSDDYISPLDGYFDTIKKRTALGTDSSKPYEMTPVKYLKCGVREDVLRFTTASHGRLMQEPFVKSVEHKVTMIVRMRDVPIENEKEWDIFRQIVGKMYNEERNELKLTSMLFASRIENKRHLVSMLDRIVINTKRLAKEDLEEERK